MSLYLTGLLWVVGAMVGAALLVTLISRVAPDIRSSDNNEALGQVFTIVGGVNAVIAAFVLISLFDSVSVAEDVAQREANALTEVHWASTALAEPSAGRIQELVRAYATEVAEREWPRMRAEEPVGDGGPALLDALRIEVDGAAAGDSWQESRKIQAADTLATVHQLRQERLAAAQSGIGSVVWFALIVGSVLALALPLLLGGPGRTAHLVIISALAGVTALIVFAIYQLQNPYTGGADVGPDAFTEVAVVSSTSTP